MMKKKNLKNGYTLLFSVIVAALVLGVAVFILSVSTKQYQLAVAGRDSMYALYAADSAMECALKEFNDDTLLPEQQPVDKVIHCYDGDSTAGPNHNPQDPPGQYSLNPMNPPSDFDITDSVNAVVNLRIALPERTCANVSIYDGYITIGTKQKRKIVINVLGYNYCNGLDPMQSPKTIERGLQLIKIGV